MYQTNHGRIRVFAELEDWERETAIEKCLVDLLRGTVEGYVEFGSDVQARINHAQEEAERMQTPWFAGELIMEAAGEELRRAAELEARETLYADSEVQVMHL